LVLLSDLLKLHSDEKFDVLYVKDSHEHLRLFQQSISTSHLYNL